MANIVDSFNRGNNASSLGVSDSGHTWIPRTQGPYIAAGPPLVYSPAGMSTLGIQGNKVYSTNSSRVNLATIDHEESDVDTVLTLNLPYGQGEGAGLVVRWQAAAQFYEVLAYHRITPPNHYYVVMRRMNSATSADDIVGGFASTPEIFLADQGSSGEHFFRVSAVGSRFRFYWDNDLKGEVFSGSYSTATHHGVLQYFSTTPIIDAYNGALSVEVSNTNIPLRQRQRSRNPERMRQQVR